MTRDSRRGRVGCYFIDTTYPDERSLALFRRAGIDLAVIEPGVPTTAER